MFFVHTICKLLVCFVPNLIPIWTWSNGRRQPLSLPYQFLHLFSMFKWAGQFLMNDVPAFVFSCVLADFLFFHTSSDYLIPCFISLTLKVLHWLGQSFFSILSRWPNYCSLLSCNIFLMLFNFGLALSSSAEIVLCGLKLHINLTIL